jgi:hypothetical protein
MVLLRIYSEFLEMPGLCLTCKQAQRLWGLDEKLCLDLLESLVEAKFLRRASHGAYSRLTDGYTERPKPRMVKADLGTPVAQREREVV